jgi:hypothetical protein
MKKERLFDYIMVLSEHSFIKKFKNLKLYQNLSINHTPSEMSCKLTFNLNVLHFMF